VLDRANHFRSVFFGDVVTGCLIALTTAQQATVFQAASGPWCLAAFLEIAAALGARRGEVLALRWADIQDGRATIARSLTQTKQVLDFKGTKTEKPRVVKIPNSALARLEAHRLEQDELRRQFGTEYKTALDLIFANPDGSPLKPNSISASVSLLFRKLKLPKGASLHSLRHTHTSHLLAKGVPLPVVSARLGHSSTRVTAEIYSHMINGQDDEAAQLWDDFQQRGQTGRERAKDVHTVIDATQKVRICLLFSFRDGTLNSDDACTCGPPTRAYSRHPAVRQEKCDVTPHLIIKCGRLTNLFPVASRCRADDLVSPSPRNSQRLAVHTQLCEHPGHDCRLHIGTDALLKRNETILVKNWVGRNLQ
jgi:hypothetical protein